MGGCVTPCGRRSGWEGVQYHVAGGQGGRGQGGRVCNVRVGGCVTPCGRRSGWEGVQYHVAGGQGGRGQGGRVCNTMWQEVRVGGVRVGGVCNTM